MANLRTAIRDLPLVLVFDNDALANPYRRVAVFEHGCGKFQADPVPAWLQPALG